MLQGRPYARRDRVEATASDVLEAVRSEPLAIGYAGIGAGDEGVKACAIDGIEPSEEQVKDGTYPIARYLYLFTARPPAGEVKRFIDWVLSREGQEVVRSVGSVPLF